MIVHVRPPRVPYAHRRHADWPAASLEPTFNRANHPTGTAARYLGRRICFSAMARTCEVAERAGLWLRVDGPLGMGALDNMQGRPLRGTTGWTRASIVLDVAPEATHLLFGGLLSGAGVLDLTRPRFDEVGEAVPVTVAPLAEEPQGSGRAP